MRILRRLAWTTAVMLASPVVFAQAAPEAPPPPAEPPPLVPVPQPVVVKEPAAAPTYPAVKGKELVFGKDISLKFGMLAQAWVDYQQDKNVVTPTGGTAQDGGYGLNFFLRRFRFNMAATISPAVNAFIQLDAPRLGFSSASGTTINKSFKASDGGGEIIQDAWLEFKPLGDVLMLEAGLMYIPFSRSQLTGSATVLGLDSSNTYMNTEYTSGGRDVGVQLKGYLLDDKLEYRVGAFSGRRQAKNATTGDPLAHNAPRIGARLQYNLFDAEKGYTFSGTYFGHKKVLGISAGFDWQNGEDLGAYKAFSAGIYGAYPLSGEGTKAGGDELAFIAEYYNYDGGAVNGTGTMAIEKQNDFIVEAAYYNKELSVSVFGKFEARMVSPDTSDAALEANLKTANNTQWFGGGIKYFLAEANGCITLAYNRVQYPDKDSTKTNNTNELTLGFQAAY